MDGTSHRWWLFPTFLNTVLSSALKVSSVHSTLILKIILALRLQLSISWALKVVPFSHAVHTFCCSFEQLQIRYRLIYPSQSPSEPCKCVLLPFLYWQWKQDTEIKGNILSFVFCSWKRAKFVKFWLKVRKERCGDQSGTNSSHSLKPVKSSTATAFGDQVSGRFWRWQKEGRGSFVMI